MRMTGNTPREIIAEQIFKEQQQAGTVAAPSGNVAGENCASSTGSAAAEIVAAIEALNRHIEGATSPFDKVAAREDRRTLVRRLVEISQKPPNGLISCGANKKE